VTPPDIAADGHRPRRLPLLIGSAVAIACLGAGVASAQTVESAAPETSTDATVDDVTTDTAGTETEVTSGEEAPAADATANDAAVEDAAVEEQRKGNRLRLRKERVTPNKVYWAGRRHAKFKFEFEGARTADLNIEVMKKKDGEDEMIRRYKRRNLEGGKTYTQTWNGRRANGDQVRRATLYFVVAEAPGRRLERKSASGDRYFKVYPAIFPVRGPHQYWDGWGAGRGHQGQDIGADCGTPMVAAEAGKVTIKGYDGGGYGYYIVVDVRGSSRSDVYGHMKDKARVAQGSNVKTGERIGKVGETGNAVGCHLHFEYRKGGSPSPAVTKKLRAWDKYS
jgi:murein DD-endopeptidase MepM/ murein hydrolase activator NlpD